MIPVDVGGVFFLASVVLALAPGPDNIFVLIQSAVHGRRAGLLVTIGLCTGLLVHTAGVALGVAVIFKTSPWAFNLLKVLGGGYLLYLAWQALRAHKQSLRHAEAARLAGHQFYLRGIIMNISNPKVALFFLAFLPQFTDPATGMVSLQVFTLGLLFILSTLLVFGSIALASGYLGQWLQKSGHAQVILNRLSALVFIILAVHLIMSVR